MEARRLAEELKRVVEEAEPVCVSSGSKAVDAGRSATESPYGDLRRSLNIQEAWSAFRIVRSEIEEETDPAVRAVKHARLDDAALELAVAAVARCSAKHRQVVQDISHDIRSPLNSILMLTDSLLKGPGSLSSVQHRQASVLYAAAVALVRLVNDVIDASRLDPGGAFAIQCAPFSVHEILAEVRRLTAPLAEHRSVELGLETDEAGRRLGDRHLLCRVLVNLVSNGVEAAGATGRVDVNVSGSASGGLTIQVVDSGLDADIARLQAMIAATAEPYPHKQEGWTRGLGLSICARLVRAADGELAVKRLEDGRTCFSLELPFSVARLGSAG